MTWDFVSEERHCNPSVRRPSHLPGKKSTFLTHKQKLRNDFASMRLQERTDKMVDTSELDEEIRSEVAIAVRMLERDTGYIRKCVECGRIVVLAKGNFFKMEKWRRHTYWCSYCLSDKRSEVNKKEKPEWYDKGKKRSDKLQKFYKPIYEGYLQQLHKGVTVYKL